MLLSVFYFICLLLAAASVVLTPRKNAFPGVPCALYTALEFTHTFWLRG